tara:strand:- start:356 stop:781 length:426 start_codon:yes stop_codon:yes gene_type:complete
MNKIILALSVVMNLSLIAIVVGLLEFLLALSIVAIGLLAWYSIKATTQLRDISSEFDDFYSRLEKYEKHIEEIHGLEMFYGDETLQSLIKHSRQILNEIYDFQVKYFIEEEEEDFDRTETQKTQEEEKEPLFHRGPSESDS